MIVLNQATADRGEGLSTIARLDVITIARIEP